MDFKRVAIIGVDSIGVSVALKLKAQQPPPSIIGYDSSKAAADMARAQGAFDRVEREPGRACKDADLVIVTTPVPAIRETFSAVAPHLQPGCLVTDTARLKAPVLRWAKEYLPKHVSFVSGHLILNPAVVDLEHPEVLEGASADLLKEALYCFIPSTDASGAAIDACSRLAQMLDAHPYFIDVTEHDGVQAGVEGLFDIVTVALLRATVESPGWQEMRNFAGRRFATATKEIDDAYERHDAVFLNRENIIQRLDILVRELMHLRNLLAQDNAEALGKTMATAAEGRARWVEKRKRGLWTRATAVDTRDVLGVGEQLGQMFLGRLASRRGASNRSREE